MNTLSYSVPYPPSTNNLFYNVPGKGRVRTQRYRTWARAAGNDILAQKRGHIGGPVHLTITLTPRRGRNPDASNATKPLEDLLVDMGIIDGDNREIVRKLTVEWDDADEHAASHALIEVCEAA